MLDALADEVDGGVLEDEVKAGEQAEGYAEVSLEGCSIREDRTVGVRFAEQVVLSVPAIFNLLYIQLLY